MMKFRLALALLLSAGSNALFGQAYTSEGVIRYAQALDVAKLDSNLPHEPLDEWLRSGPPHLDSVQWAVSDCDLMPPMTDQNLDWPLCAKGWFGRHSKTGDVGG